VPPSTILPGFNPGSVKLGDQKVPVGVPRILVKEEEKYSNIIL
jgi:hypothetical protein